VSSCSSGVGRGGGGGSHHPEPSDYSPEVVELLDEFNAIAVKGHFSDDSETLDSFVSNAKKMSALVIRAENEGVDLSAVDAVWFREFKKSSEGLIALIGDYEKPFTEEELRTHLERVLGWYAVASNECRPFIS